MAIKELVSRAQNKVKVSQAHHQNDRIWRKLADKVAEKALPSAEAPVVFFDASTRLGGVSLNGAYSVLTSWSMRLQGVPIVRFVCHKGMTQCVLGTSREEPPKAPPCATCMRQSAALFKGSETYPFQFNPDAELDQALEGLGLEELSQFSWQGMPFGELVLPSVRWILRRHNLQTDATTLRILREYIRSAWSLADQFRQMLEKYQPRAVVVFNGMQYPEATARWVARSQGLRVISHEVGLRPFTAFFTDGDATAYPLRIPVDFELDDAQNARLDEYLSQRFKGQFKMAGVQFWPEMEQDAARFEEFKRGFSEVIPVFTNVIFDTSQPHANTLFEDMFTWLDEILAISKRHPRTLFVIRAHPDEIRKGKASEESVTSWAESKQVAAYPNVRFIPPDEFISSYDLIRMAKLVLVYNSTIGLEASILGKPVLAAGKSRYSGADTVWFPPSLEAYRLHLEGMLNQYEIETPQRFARNARRFLFYQLYRSSLSFEAFLEEDGVWAGYVKPKDFDWQSLLPANSSTMQAISDGVLNDGNFILPQEDL